MKVILKNTTLSFVSSKSLEYMSYAYGYVTLSGGIIAGTDFKYFIYDVSKISKLKLTTTVNTATPVVYVLKKNGSVVYPFSWTSATTGGTYDSIIDTFDADEIWVNTSDVSVENPITCEVVSYNYNLENEITGTTVSGYLNDSGSVTSSQYFHVTKYDVTDYYVVNIFSCLNATSENFYVLKKAGANLGAPIRTQSTVLERNQAVVDVSEADEIWVSGIVDYANSCFAVL